MNWFGKSNSTNASKGVSNASKGVSNVAKKTPMELLYVTGFKQTTIVLIVLCAIFVLTLVIMYIVNRVKSSKLGEVVLTQDVITLDNAKEIPYKVDASKMSLVSPGHEFSFNFWIYLGANYQTTSGHKLLLTRGTLPDTPSGKVDYSSNPVIFLDKGTNRLYFAFSTNAVTSAKISLDDILQKDVNGRYVNGWLVTYIDYVPLQRWVNLSVVVRDNSAYVFMDADMYSTVTVNDIVINDSMKRPIIRGNNGDLTIGSRSYSTNGYLTFCRFYNYALTQNEIQGIYKTGPVKKTWLSIFGLGSYGLRSPVFRLD
jgi:hypothetical protein